MNQKQDNINREEMLCWINVICSFQMNKHHKYKLIRKFSPVFSMLNSNGVKEIQHYAFNGSRLEEVYVIFIIAVKQQNTG